MSNYRRFYVEGGWYFFTVVTYERKPLFASPENIERLRKAFQKGKTRYPFRMDFVVILPDHLHCIWKLPEDDHDFSTRWKYIKKCFSIQLPSIPNKRGEKRVWQKRFWEHWIRDQEDWLNHVNYIHFNPVKHGYVAHPVQWEYSSFHQAMEMGLYPKDIEFNDMERINNLDLE